VYPADVGQSVRSWREGASVCRTLPARHAPCSASASVSIFASASASTAACCRVSSTTSKVFSGATMATRTLAGVNVAGGLPVVTAKDTDVEVSSILCPSLSTDQASARTWYHPSPSTATPTPSAFKSDAPSSSTTSVQLVWLNIDPCCSAATTKQTVRVTSVPVGPWDRRSASGIVCDGSVLLPPAPNGGSALFEASSTVPPNASSCASSSDWRKRTRSPDRGLVMSSRT